MKFISAAAIAALGTATAAFATPPATGTASADVGAAAAAQTTTQPAATDTAASTSVTTSAEATSDAMKAAPKTGDAVFDKTGEAVGTIESVTDKTFVLATEDGKATLEISALRHGPKGHMIALTKAELSSAIRSAAADKL